MLRHKRTKFRLLPGKSEQQQADENAREEELYAARKMHIDNLSGMIERRTWENGQLRHELQYQQRKHGASVFLLEQVRLAVESLQEALGTFERMNGDIEQDMSREHDPQPGLDSS